jgi:GT2 family glycosyltransferase
MKISVVIPTLAADEALTACLESLAAQTLREFEIIVVDNSGRGVSVPEGVRVMVNAENRGYGGAVNQGIRASEAPFLLALNDDTILEPDCLANLLAAMTQRREIGMCAPQIRLHPSGEMDSAGLRIAPDGASKQYGHGDAPSGHSRPREALLPSGCAALYRRDMLEETGLFAEDFFLYCEDTDLGLRARWKAWECVYVPRAVVHHRYSHSSGRASALKAYYAERNRWYLVVRNFPARDLWRVPWHTAVRYFWHWRYARRGQGKAAEFGASSSLAGIALRAAWDAFRHAPELWRQRREIQKHARLTPQQFSGLLRHYRISGRQVASL